MGEIPKETSGYFLNSAIPEGDTFVQTIAPSSYNVNKCVEAI